MKITGLCDTCAFRDEKRGVVICGYEFDRAFIDTAVGEMHFHDAIYRMIQGLKTVPTEQEIIDCEDYEEKRA